MTAVHAAMLSLPKDAPQRLYDAEKLGKDYVWSPFATMNGSSNALFNAWELLRNDTAGMV